MPVDYCVCLLPLLIVVAGMMALRRGPCHRKWRWLTLTLLLIYFMIYFAPGWVLWIAAQNGNADAQYQLGHYYWTRLGNNWPDIEARDKWWVEAAKQGHAEAMAKVRYFSMFGSSQYIPRDPVAAKQWLDEEAERAAIRQAAP